MAVDPIRSGNPSTVEHARATWHWRGSSLAGRLAIVIAVVSLASINVLSFLTLHLANEDISSISRANEVSFGRAISGSMADSYARKSSWSSADVAGVTTLAAKRGLAVTLLDASGRPVVTASPAHLKGSLGPAYAFPIDEGSTRVGTLQVRAGDNGLGIAGSVRDALRWSVGWSSLAAAILAIGAGVVLSRRLTAPVVRLTEAARALGEGRRGVRVSTWPATEDIAELSRAFNAMAGNLELHEQQRSRLVADVAHELRTPAAVIQGWLEATVDGVVEMDKETMSSLLSESLRLSRIVKDLQVLASSDVAALDLECSPVDLSEVASEAATSLGTKVTEADLTLIQELEPVVVNGDRIRLHQVIGNLLTNSIKFTPAGGLIRLAVARQGPTARVTVEDTGIGIPADELPHIFKRFWRGPGASRRPGSGIGLAVVADLVQAHGGEIAAVSRAGKGTRFVVTLPAE